ncbi:SMP-30/gluconolactonase/LRE family protein [Streptacidiphilus sp. EB129]|uniref:SMP-30/gluconolactonase/LRE family protein n=1 Tax=Streptacidiphilus sp. EB129 TaxID=3156262 RepID=UPI003517B125
MQSTYSLKVVGLAVSAAVLVLTVPAQADTPTPGFTHVHIADHFDLAAGQQPENIALEPDGAVDLSMSVARQVVRLHPDGRQQVLAQLPPPADGGVHTPLLGFPLVAGLVRTDDGTLYFLYATGTADLTGLWRLRPGGTPERITALPADSLPNGLGLDPVQGEFYSADSALGTVWRMPISGGVATAWTVGPELAPRGTLGANGLKVHHGAVWVTNLALGTILRIPIRRDGAAGPFETRATGLPGIDDFAFIPHSNRIVAALDSQNKVAIVEPDGSYTAVLTGQDGLENPTSVAVRGNTVYIPSAAWTLRKDPNLITAQLPAAAEEWK